MDVKEIKQYLINNPDKIRILLEASGFQNISSNPDEYRCSRDEFSNPTSVRVIKGNLSSVCFSTNISGDIITLISEKMNLDFRSTLNFIAKTLGLEPGEFKKKKIKLPFNGYYKKISNSDDTCNHMETIPDDTLNQFIQLPNMAFYNDGISFETQKKYKIAYDPFTNRIIIPHWDLRGNLVGFMGRFNGEVDNQAKYIPVGKSFPKGRALYGFSQNYNEILSKRMVIIGESEKFVMQLDTMGVELGLGLGGSFLTNVHANAINSLQPKIILLAYDEGVDEEVMLESANKLKINNPFNKNKVGYIYDKDNKYLPKGSKCSPTDLGYNTYEKLIKECVVWVE